MVDALLSVYFCVTRHLNGQPWAIGFVIQMSHLVTQRESWFFGCERVVVKSVGGWIADATEPSTPGSSPHPTTKG
jgi:hypothetical protein